MYQRTLEELLNEPGDSFPKRSEKITIISGRTLTKTQNWHKAIVLVVINEKKQLRLYGWRKNKDGQWRVGQNFNISKGYAAKISEILDAFVTGAG